MHSFEIESPRRSPVEQHSADVPHAAPKRPLFTDHFSKNQFADVRARIHQGNVATPPTLGLVRQALVAPMLLDIVLTSSGDQTRGHRALVALTWGVGVPVSFVFEACVLATYPVRWMRNVLHDPPQAQTT